MFKKSFYSLVSVMALCCGGVCAGSANADTPDNTGEMKVLETKIQALEKRIESLSGKISSSPVQSAVDASGLKIGGGATFVMQSTIDANGTDKEGEDVTDATFSVDIEIEKSIGDNGTVFAHMEAGNGAGLDGEEVLSFGGVNADATGGDSNVALIEMWYEHAFSENMVLTAGKIDATCYLDDNAFANDECGQFLGGSFKNSAAIDFPDDNGMGLRLMLAPSEMLEINLGIVEADGDWEDVSEDSFLFGQINLMPELGGKEGNYRLYGWLNNKAHTDFNDAAKDNESNSGFGISVDQLLTDNLGVFMRVGTQKSELAEVDCAWSLGMQLAGNIWNRENDVFGIAFGQNMISDDYGKTGEPDSDESHFEMYYNFYVNDALSISPDFQIITNPNGVGSADQGRDDDVYIIGIRAQMGF